MSDLIVAMKRFRNSWNRMDELEAQLSQAEKELITARDHIASILATKGVTSEDGFVLHHEDIVIECSGKPSVGTNNLQLKQSFTPTQIQQM